MLTALNCVPCFVRQTLEAVRFITSDTAAQEKALRTVLRAAADMDLSQPPPIFALQIHRNLRDITGIEDPYRLSKDRFNRLALAILPGLRELARESADPFLTVVRLAIAGNVIDMGVNRDLSEDKIMESIQDALSEPFHGEIEEFRKAAFRAKKILYLADNAGEIVFDRLLIERLPPGRMTVAVRGGPILNDATHEDARISGLCDIAEVIDNGSSAPGTILQDCSPDFREHFAEADLIIAKGQGNFETLDDIPANLFFLFKVKCRVIASAVGLDEGTQVLRKSAVSSSLEARRL